MMKRGWPQVKYKYKTSFAGSKNETEDPFLLEDEKKWRKNTSTPPTHREDQETGPVQPFKER